MKKLFRNGKKKTLSVSTPHVTYVAWGGPTVLGEEELLLYLAEECRSSNGAVFAMVKAAPTWYNFMGFLA